MNYMLDQYLGLYEKAYNDAVRANELKNLPLAHRKFTEAAMYSRKLASLDPRSKDTYNSRADKLANIAAGIQKTIDQSNSARSPVSVGGGAPQSVGSLTATGSEMEIDEEMSAFYTFYSADSLSGGFESVIGLEEAKEAVTEYVINPIRYPDAYNYNFMDNKCILLEGPPGTGKTTFAKAVAKEIKQPFALVNVAGLVNCYVGETAKTIDKVFASLRSFAERNNSGITVFFDEFDEIAKSRTGDDKASQTAVPALLRNLDGIQQNKNFLIIANTNCVEMLDKGIQDRFRRKIFIPLPDKDMRKRFFKDKLSQLERIYFEKLNTNQLAEASEGLSGRAITYICDDFLRYVGGVKAGLKPGDDLNNVMLNLIKKKMEETL